MAREGSPGTMNRKRSSWLNEDKLKMWVLTLFHSKKQEKYLLLSQFSNRQIQKF